MHDLDRRIRHQIYESFAAEGRPPTPDECGAACETDRHTVLDAWRRLAAAHEIVLAPGEDRIWMAHPFSGMPTDHVVEVGVRRWFANCAWDGLAILALFGDGQMSAPDPNTGEEVRWTVRSDVVRPDGVVHFLVPARRFWDDIGFT